MPRNKRTHIHPTHPFFLSQPTSQVTDLSQVPVLSNQLRRVSHDIKHGCPHEVPLEGGQGRDSSLRRNRGHLRHFRVPKAKEREEQASVMRDHGINSFSQSVFQNRRTKTGRERRWDMKNQLCKSTFLHPSLRHSLRLK